LRVRKKAEAESGVFAADNVWLWNNILTLVTAGENYWALLFARTQIFSHNVV
jgi:hypothetical protein